MSAWNEHVLPHGPLTQLAPRVWQVTGSLRRMALPRNMTLWKMDDGGVWVHSAVACDDATMAEILAIGPPAVLVVPNGLHRVDAGVWKDRFPGIRVVCPEASRAKVEQAVKMDALDTEVPGVIVHAPPGLNATEHVYEVDAGAGKAIVVCDVLFNIGNEIPGFGGWMLKLMGSAGPLKMTPLARLVLLQDGRAFRGWLEGVAAAPDLALLCMAHGEAILADTALKLKEAAARL